MIAQKLPVLVGLSAAICCSARADELFPLGVYWPQERLPWLAEKAGLDKWEYAEQLLARLHDEHHCNFVWVVNIGPDELKQLCGLAAKHEVHVAGSVPAVYWWRQHRTPEFAVRCAQHTVETFGEAPGLDAYVLIDEPRAWELSYLDAIRHELARLDPTRTTIMVTMRGDTPAAIHNTEFPIITSDIYPYYHHGDPNGPYLPHTSRAYYRNAADAFVSQAEQAGKTYWMMPGAFEEIWGDWCYDDRWNVIAQPRAYLHSRMPTVGETRWQVWEAASAGCKGVIFFVLFPPGNDRTVDSEPGPEPTHPFPQLTEALEIGQPAALINPDFSATDQMVAMGEAFAEVQRLAPILLDLSRSPYPAAFTDPPLTCRTLRHAGGDLYVSVVNDNTEEAVQGKLRLLPGPSSAQDVRKGAQLSLGADEASGLLTASVELGPGEGTLVQVVAEPGRRPLAAHVEDFETPIVPGKLENAAVQARRLAWGVGWDRELVASGDGEEVAAGTLTCDVKTLTGDPAVHRPSGPIYVVYTGRGEGVELRFSPDGETYETASTDEFGKPVPLPRSASHLRFTVHEGAGLSGFCVIATETGSE